MIIGYVGGLSPSRFIQETVRVACAGAGVEFRLAGQHLPECDIALCLYDPKFRNNRYGMPNKLYTALKEGRPIIVTKGSDAGDFVERMQCGVTCEYDIQSFMKLLNNMPDLTILEKNARLAYKTYNWYLDKQKLVAVYLELL